MNMEKRDDLRAREVRIEGGDSRHYVDMKYAYDDMVDLVVKQMSREGEPHGVTYFYDKLSEDEVARMTYVYYWGEKLVNHHNMTTEEHDVNVIEQFLLKEALAYAADTPSSSVLFDDELIVPALKWADDAGACLYDLAKNGLDSEHLKQAHLEVYNYDFTKDLYFKHFDALEMGDLDRFEVANAYMDQFDSKTFPDVVVSQALKENCEQVYPFFTQALRDTLNLYVPLMDTETLLNALNYLETNRFEIKDKIEEVYNERQQQKVSKVNDRKLNKPERKRGRSM